MTAKANQLQITDSSSCPKQFFHKLEKTLMRFNQVSCVEDLVTTMDGRAKKHDALHYFTRLSVLDSIVKKQAWQFNNSSGMNDLHELIKNLCFDSETNEAIQRKRARLYYSCFSFGDEDNVAMWSLYGIPWEDAVCITLEKDSVKSLLNSMGKYANANNAETFFHDICYIEGKMGAAQGSGGAVHRDSSGRDTDTGGSSDIL